MPAMQTRSPTAAPQTGEAAPEKQAPAQQESESSSGVPEWDYAFSAGNSAVLSLIAGDVATDEETAGSLLRGGYDVETLDTAPESADRVPTDAELEAAPKAVPVAPTTTNPGGKLSKPFQKHQTQVPAASLTLTAGQKSEIRVFQANWIANKAKYQAVAAKTGVPAELIAAIHYRESSLNFNTYLHQGDPLGKKAVNVPSNIPVFHDWEEAAIHALNMKRGIRDGLSMTADTEDEVAMASYAEAYNGLGYYNRGKASPYVYAGTDQYKGGMYVADHKFSNVAKDRRLGVLALTRSVDGNGATDLASGASADKRTEAQVWAAVLSGHILRLGQSGREVEELQKRLAAAGHAVGVDGQFGRGTDTAVKAAQRASGLTPDGVVGVNTAAALDRNAPAKVAANEGTGPETTAVTGPETTPKTATDTTTTPTGPEQASAPPEWSQLLAGQLTLEYRASGAVVSHLQTRLNAAGFTVDVDGKYGPATRAALNAFQQARGLRVDGIVGAKTAAALG